MTSVLTGDIISSKAIQPDIWLPALKKAFAKIQPNKDLYEIYRGDSFQIELNNVYDSFINALYIKACIRSIKGIDVRIAIGLGNKTYSGSSIKESNGTAFHYSGSSSEQLKSLKRNLMIKTNNKIFDDQFNLYFRLALIAMDNWTSNSAEAIKLMLENKGTTQQSVAEKIGVNQDAISKRLKRGYFDELLELEQMFKHKLAEEL